MTEDDWLTTTRSSRMLRYLEEKGFDRKLRLISCAFCRPIRRFLTDERSLHALEVADRFADGHATEAEMAAVVISAGIASEAAQNDSSLTREARMAAAAVAMAAAAVDTATNEFVSPYGAATAVTEALSGIGNPYTMSFILTTEAQIDAWSAAEAPQSTLIRHIIGNPFRPHPPLPHVPATVRNLAEAVYQQKQTAVGPLHDALLDAGLPDLADHFTDVEEWHPKGCWAVDILTGRA